MSLLNLENRRSGEIGVTAQIYEVLLQKKQKKQFFVPTESRNHLLRLAWIAGRRFNLDMKISIQYQG